MDTFLREQAEIVIKRALLEDLSNGDITTDALIPDDLYGRAIFTANVEGIVAGVEVCDMVLKEVDPSLVSQILIHDGYEIHNGEKISTVTGRVCSILKAERIALNFLQRLSGIATQTSKYVKAVSGFNVEILDTRKTTPGLRILEKYAVRLGGGNNHRKGLGDGILIKDNHLIALSFIGVGLAQAVEKARYSHSHNYKIEVEVETVEQALIAMDSHADILLLDNMSIEDMRKVAMFVPRGVILEASGGINLGNVRAIAETGVHRISIGSLTHSVTSLDISLDMESAENNLLTT